MLIHGRLSAANFSIQKFSFLSSRHSLPSEVHKERLGRYYTSSRGLVCCAREYSSPTCQHFSFSSFLHMENLPNLYYIGCLHVPPAAYAAVSCSRSWMHDHKQECRLGKYISLLKLILNLYPFMLAYFCHQQVATHAVRVSHKPTHLFKANNFKRDSVWDKWWLFFNYSNQVNGSDTDMHNHLIAQLNQSTQSLICEVCPDNEVGLVC